MLPLSIILLVLALVTAGFSALGVVGAGAMPFALGFLLLGVISMLGFWSSRRSTVF